MISGVHIPNISPADRARKETAPAETGVESEHLTGSRPVTLLPFAKIWTVAGGHSVKGAGNPRALIVLSPDEGEVVEFGVLGVRFMIDGAQSGGETSPS